MNLKARFVILAVIVGLFAGFSHSAVWTYHRIPHLAYGGGYMSYLTVRDPQAVTSRYLYIYLRDDNGSLLAASVEGIGATNTDADQNKPPYYGSSFYISLSAAQEKTFSIYGTGGLKTGWVAITAEGPGNLTASLRFASRDAVSGETTDVVGILPAEPNFNWSVSVEKRTATDYTGLAISNPYSSPLSFSVDFYQNGSRVAGTTTRTFNLPAYGHLARFVHEAALFGDAWNSFTGIGTLRISSAANTFSVVALRGDGTQYSSLPADPGVQFWNMTYTDSRGVQNCTWSWKGYDGYTFTGAEQNPDNPNTAVRLRGVAATDLTPKYFLAEWNYAKSSDNTQGVIVFQGTISREESTDVVYGKRMEIRSDGTVLSTYNFKATRIY